MNCRSYGACFTFHSPRMMVQHVVIIKEMQYWEVILSYKKGFSSLFAIYSSEFLLSNPFFSLLGCLLQLRFEVGRQTVPKLCPSQHSLWAMRVAFSVSYRLPLISLFIARGCMVSSFSWPRGLKIPRVNVTKTVTVGTEEQPTFPHLFQLDLCNPLISNCL